MLITDVALSWYVMAHFVLRVCGVVKQRAALDDNKNEALYVTASFFTKVDIQTPRA
jgi:hypothetical protein